MCIVHQILKLSALKQPIALPAQAFVLCPTNSENQIFCCEIRCVKAIVRTQFEKHRSTKKSCWAKIIFCGKKRLKKHHTKFKTNRKNRKRINCETRVNVICEREKNDTKNTQTGFRSIRQIKKNSKKIQAQTNFTPNNDQHTQRKSEEKESANSKRLSTKYN